MALWPGLFQMVPALFDSVVNLQFIVHTDSVVKYSARNRYYHGVPARYLS